MPTTTREIDIKEFARRVENVCRFFLDKVANEESRDDSDDLRVIEDLANEAADIQCDKIQMMPDLFNGLASYMKGANVP